MKKLLFLSAVICWIQLFSCSSPRDDNKGVKPREGSRADSASEKIDEHGASATGVTTDTTATIKNHLQDTTVVPNK